jgi:Family of unknown function (DUF5715)
MKSPVGIFITYLICAAMSSEGKTTKPFAATQASVYQENQAADAMGARRFITQAEVDKAIQRQQLEPLYNNTTYVVAPALPIERRYALPGTVKFVELVSLDFYHQFHKPLMVDSAIRPAMVQLSLRKRNSCAAPAYGNRASTHLRGTTIDFSKKMSKEELKWTLVRLGYYRGIGRILIINEARCLHIFVIGADYVPAEL